jgi:branched-chain amino acid transport system permease protein
MSAAAVFYLTTLLVYLGVDILAAWSLNLQWGIAGIPNLAWILFQSAGAYTAAVLTLGPSSGNGGFQSYIIGARLPFPLPLLAGGVVAGVLALLVGLVVLRRLRGDYQAVVLLVITVTATLLVQNFPHFLNGPAGLALIPQPLASGFASSIGYAWFYVGLTAVVCALVYFFVVRRITGSPLGRSMRAMRDADFAAAALGKNVVGLRLFVFVVGGVIAGLSGALLVEFITAWSPGGWMYVESLVVFTAIIVGGTGNDFGVMAGALLVPVLFNEITRYIPTFGTPYLVDALQWVVIGSLALAFMWFRPRGLFPERRRTMALGGPGTPAAGPGSPLAGPSRAGAAAGTGTAGAATAAGELGSGA